VFYYLYIWTRPANAWIGLYIGHTEHIFFCFDYKLIDYYNILDQFEYKSNTEKFTRSFFAVFIIQSIQNVVLFAGLVSICVFFKERCQLYYPLFGLNHQIIQHFVLIGL
jgi:hypothetical protein